MSTVALPPLSVHNHNVTEPAYAQHAPSASHRGHASDPTSYIERTKRLADSPYREQQKRDGRIVSTRSPFQSESGRYQSRSSSEYGDDTTPWSMSRRGSSETTFSRSPAHQRPPSRGAIVKAAIDRGWQVDRSKLTSKALKSHLERLAIDSTLAASSGGSPILAPVVKAEADARQRSTGMRQHGMSSVPHGDASGSSQMPSRHGRNFSTDNDEWPLVADKSMVPSPLRTSTTPANTFETGETRSSPKETRAPSAATLQVSTAGSDMGRSSRSSLHSKNLSSSSSSSGRDSPSSAGSSKKPLNVAVADHTCRFSNCSSCKSSEASSPTHWPSTPNSSVSRSSTPHLAYESPRKPPQPPMSQSMTRAQNRSPKPSPSPPPSNYTPSGPSEAGIRATRAATAALAASISNLPPCPETPSEDVYSPNKPEPQSFFDDGSDDEGSRASKSKTGGGWRRVKGVVGVGTAKDASSHSRRNGSTSTCGSASTSAGSASTAATSVESSPSSTTALGDMDRARTHNGGDKFLALAGTGAASIRFGGGRRGALWSSARIREIGCGMLPRDAPGLRKVKSDTLGRFKGMMLCGGFESYDDDDDLD